jgi:hypothetical protein
LFWTIPVPRRSIDVHLGAGQASFRLTTEIFDDHDLMSSLTGAFPAGFPQMAEVTFDIEWGGVLDRARIRNQAMNFEGEFVQTGCTIEWSARNPSSGFTFSSAPAETSQNVYALLGRERNGVFFE